MEIPYLTKMNEEYYDLSSKIDKLELALDRNNPNSLVSKELLDFNELDMMTNQLKVMIQYKNILKMRIDYARSGK